MAFDAAAPSTAEADFAPLPMLDDRYALFVTTELKRTAYVEQLRRSSPDAPRFALTQAAGHLLSWGWDQAATAASLDGDYAAAAVLDAADRARLADAIPALMAREAA